ncbi:MAG: flagellar basal body P-ring formation protein FlgA [Rhodobacteraceae bacterium]|uniref:flagellar basal body P-ring formation chaperone FlgA n=1 Tax=Amaricoccus sp. B4 TaxID=3368557 RepID=UPI000DAD69DD|nr:flagellar basal body P-ring formation protein FlgA [Paracoccaceae bacterium]
MTPAARLLLTFATAALAWAALPSEPPSAQAVVPVRAIRGTNIVGAEDVEIAKDKDLPGAIHALEDVVGQEAKVTLYPGRPILRGQVGAPALVERNAVVRMIYEQGPLNITADGRVLDRGGVGETVRVMNLSSRQIVAGTVEADGSVKVEK